MLRGSSCDEGKLYTEADEDAKDEYGNKELKSSKTP
jgi:hypothetical protein